MSRSNRRQPCLSDAILIIIQIVWVCGLDTIRRGMIDGWAVFWGLQVGDDRNLESIILFQPQWDVSKRKYVVYIVS